MPERLDLIVEVFDALDEDGDGRLNEQELLKFARSYEFYDTDERWSTVYRSLCDALSVDADAGFGATAFMALVDREALGCYCDDVVLRWMLEEISPKPPTPAPPPLPTMFPEQSAAAMHAAMFGNLQRMKSFAQGLPVPEFEYQKPMESHPLMGLAGLPGYSVDGAAKLIAAGGIKRGDSKPPGAGRRRKVWIDCPWLKVQQATAKPPAEDADDSQDLDPLGIDSLPETLDPLGIDSLPDVMEPLGTEAAEPVGIETIGIRRLKPEEAAESATRVQRLRQEAARPPAWLCEQFPRRRHWRSWRVCSLRVDEEVGAGLELEATYAGHRVHDVEHFPGQAEALCAGTVIMCINGQPLVGLDEEALDEVFDSHFCDGAEVMLMDWDELCEALDEKEAEPGSDGFGGLEGVSVDGSSWLPADGAWKRGSGRRVVAGASQKLREVHDRLETRAEGEHGEDEKREAAPLLRFNPRCNQENEEGEEDSEASRKLFFDLAGPAPCTDICELVPQTSFTRAVKTYAGEGMQETNPFDYALGAALELTYMTDNAEGAATPDVDPSRDLRWVSLEERFAMEPALETRPRADAASSSTSRGSRRSQPLGRKRTAVAKSGSDFDGIGSWAVNAQASLAEDAEKKPMSKPPAKAMAPMPKARPLGAGPRPRALGGQPASSSTLGAGFRGYPLGASSSSWIGRSTDDEMGEFYSFRIPKSTARPRQPKFGGQQGHQEKAPDNMGDMAKARPFEHVTEQAVDVD